MKYIAMGIKLSIQNFFIVYYHSGDRLHGNGLAPDAWPDSG